MPKILLTNGAYKQTLAVARCLGAAGYEVGIVSHHWLSVGFFTKYCRHRHIINTQNPKDYVSQLITLLKTSPYDVVLPIGYPQTGWLAEYAAEIRCYTKLPLADVSAFKIFENKALTHDLAQKLSIPVPKTFAPQTLEQATLCLKELQFPVVFKKTKEGENHMAYAQNESDFFRFFAEFQTFTEGFIIQEYISGRGAGYFALYNEGTLIHDFMHLRLREYPVEGGAACFAESIDNELLRTYGKNLLSTAKWHGVAMVEFKFDAQGIPRLLEVNPKFWGSYDLCVAANADFAVPLIEITLGQTPKVPPQYKTQIRFSWLMNGDLLYGIKTGHVRQVLRDFFHPTTQSNLIWQDPFATVFLIITGCFSIIKTLLKK
ncbi:MAG: hypothetical protein JNL70_08035 [Saprospiraceae bacterium]|nr:hypothetical protein [Saprospiraceae bacterium]